MRLGAFVITHHRPETLRHTLAALLGQSVAPEAVLVVDNGRTPATRAVVEGFASRGARYDDPGSNLGPAGAAARGLGWSLEQGFDWTYWGDDDDPPATSDTLSRLATLLERVQADGEEAAGGVAAVGARWDWRTGRLVRLADRELSGPVEVDAIGGNSQLVLASRAVRAVGLPDPELFFGWEEIEYCLRIRAAGLRLVVDGDLMRSYRGRAGRLGAAGARRARRPPVGQPWRQYYATRNYIHLMRRRFDRPDLARREVARALARAALAWRRGTAYGAAFGRLQVRGVLDGFRDRMGRTVEPTAGPAEGATRAGA